MSKHLLARLAVLFFVCLGYFCLAARPAVADNIITLNVTGQAFSQVTSTTTSFTGQYQFDVTTDSIGAWSFDFPGLVANEGAASFTVGTISGTSGTVTENASGTDTLDFTTTAFDGTQVEFNVNDPSDLVSNGQGTIFVGLTAASENADPLSSVTVSEAPAVATPEPSSLFLLGTSLLGLGPLVRRFTRA